MKKALRLLVIAAAVLGAVPPERTFAAPAAPTPGTTYDGLPPGSRPLAMGMAFAAVGGDPSSFFFNPAGLSNVDRSLFSLTYEATRQSALTADQVFSGEMLRGRNLIFLSLSSQKGTFSWRPLANSVLRTVNGADSEETEIKVNAYTVSASQEASSTLSTGLSLSYLTGQIAQSGMRGGAPFINLSDGNGFSADLGFLYTVSPEVRLGLNLQNLVGFMWWEDFEKDQLPFTVRTGIAFRITELMTFASDWEKRFYRQTGPVDLVHFGLEQNVGKALSLRAGMYGSDLNDKETAHLSAGLGYRGETFELSLAGEKYRVDAADVYRYVFGLNLPL